MFNPHRDRNGHRQGPIGISSLGQAALAVALKERDEFKAEQESIKENWHRERRYNEYLQRQEDQLEETITRLRKKIEDLEARLYDLQSSQSLG